jgi:hypothetical protein
MIEVLSVPALRSHYLYFLSFTINNGGLPLRRIWQVSDQVSSLPFTLCLPF